MIESNIMEWIDLGDSIQIMEIYSKKDLVKFFNCFRIMSKYKPENRFFILFVKFFFFFQIMMIPIINLKEESKKKDSLIKLLNYVKTVIFVQDIIKKKNDLIILLCFSYLYCAILFSLLFYLILFQNKKVKIYLIKLLNVLNILFQNFLLCPLINIFMLTTKCKDSKHIHLDLECWKDVAHIVLGVLSVLLIVICIIYSELLAIYYNQISSIKFNHILHSINSNYHLFSNTLSIICYFLGYFLEYYTDENKMIYKIGIRIFICIISIVLL